MPYRRPRCCSKAWVRSMETRRATPWGCDNPADSGAHEHRRIVALEILQRAAVGVVDHLLRRLVGARRELYAQHHVIPRAGVVVAQVLLNELADAVAHLVDEAQVRGVVHRVLGGAVGSARLAGELAPVSYTHL